ncbi:DUF72 domain-containing protein [Variovorax sp. RHLX14]|uniref:DUF72 domain-containing protein n=1 Tax=Variovorax sp. RHLX14 TaxID=1259731 RepID=UPI003F483A31
MQDLLFSTDDDADPNGDSGKQDQAVRAPGKTRSSRTGTVLPQPAAPDDIALAQALHPQIRLGTSSWSYPGWDGLVWDGRYSDSMLARHGIPAYSAHPLFRTVSIDKGFYKPLGVVEYSKLADAVPADFRFVVKAPSMVTDAVVRSEEGRGRQPNPAFLSPEIAVNDFVRPALEGLGEKLGALVFQLSPLPMQFLSDQSLLLEKLGAMLRALPSLRPVAPDGVIAVEVRDPVLLGQPLANVLRETGATFCLGLHAKMQDIDAQLPMLRALWPGPLVCRWNLNPVNGAYGYEDARDLYAPYDKLVDVDPKTRDALARVAAATARAGYPVYVTVSNKAEGSAPLSVRGLAETLRAAG